MRAFCPKCRQMVTIWTVLKMDEAERLLSENQPIEVVHPCPETGGDYQWAVEKAEGLSKGQKA